MLLNKRPKMMCLAKERQRRLVSLLDVANSGQRPPCSSSVSFSQTIPRTAGKSFLIVEGASFSVLWYAPAPFTHWGFKASIDPETMATKR